MRRQCEKELREIQKENDALIRDNEKLASIAGPWEKERAQLLGEINNMREREHKMTSEWEKSFGKSMEERNKEQVQ
jgi:hypothetical protein